MYLLLIFIFYEACSERCYNGDFFQVTISPIFGFLSLLGMCRSVRLKVQIFQVKWTKSHFWFRGRSLYSRCEEVLNMLFPKLVRFIGTPDLEACGWVIAICRQRDIDHTYRLPYTINRKKKFKWLKNGQIYYSYVHLVCNGLKWCCCTKPSELICELSTCRESNFQGLRSQFWSRGG